MAGGWAETTEDGAAGRLCRESLPWWRATPLSHKERCRGDACVARKAFVNRRDNTGDACVAPTIVHECTGGKSAGLRKFHTSTLGKGAPGTATLRLGVLSCHGVANPAMWTLKDQYP